MVPHSNFVLHYQKWLRMFTFFFHVLTGPLYIFFAYRSTRPFKFFVHFYLDWLSFYCWIVESDGHSSMHLFLDSQFCTIGLVYIFIILTPEWYCFDFFIFLVNFEIRECDFLLIFQFYFSYSETLIYINLWIEFSDSEKKMAIIILIGITLNLLIMLSS